MFDIGANLSHIQFNNDLASVIQNSIDSNVTGILLTSVDRVSFEKNLNIIKDYGDKIFLKTTFGLHPHYANLSSQVFPFAHEALENDNVISIGEFGLDYYRMISSKENQIQVMVDFLSLAKSHPTKSLFLHEREAFNDFYQLLKNFKGDNHKVVHCFGSNKDQMFKYLDLNCYIGFTGWISDIKRNHDVVEAIKNIPIDRILVETDAPYLTPFNIPNRVRRNEPANLKYIIETISSIKQIPMPELIESINTNTKTFFNF